MIQCHWHSLAYNGKPLTFECVTSIYALCGQTCNAGNPAFMPSLFQHFYGYGALVSKFQFLTSNYPIRRRNSSICGAGTEQQQAFLRADCPHIACLISPTDFSALMDEGTRL